MSEQRPQNISDKDWEIYLRFRRYEDEQSRKKAHMGQSNQFHYVPGESEATAEAVLGK